MEPEERHEAVRLQRINVLDLQQTTSAVQVIPITYRIEPRSGVPFSALND